ncbi:LysR family transcriptional regulator (plasmid) [Ensifer adhaerens]|uniref:LysR family transcriptional regulator n=1 Tax=Ensifer adhaerens TaxID=106592 RepID=UPI0023A95569|nr:LysR family transcriptional regulator [Ensifer adhaerens]WDZ81935.1 LysR family transcriptional regulator [Ensifer adhaerens]
MKPKLNKRRKLLGRVSDSDMHLFRVFCAVVNCGGFSAAQGELGVGRSTISRQISHLETRLGYMLCHRGRSGFVLTQHGEQAFALIEKFLSASEQFTADMAAINDDFVGRLNIAIVDYCFTDKRNPVLPAIREFRMFAPRVEINLVVDSPNAIERGILDGSLHLGVLPVYRQLEELIYTELYEETASLYAGLSHPLVEELRADAELPIDRITRHELVFRGYLEGEKLLKFKQQFRRGPTVLQTEAQAALIHAGAYLGFLPRHAAHADLVCVRPEVFDHSASICVAVSRGRRRSMIAGAFLERLQEGSASHAQRG